VFRKYLAGLQMSKPKVVTVVGTRPEIIRLSRLIPRLDEDFDHVLVNTGQNSDPRLNDIFFQDLELRQPDVWLKAPTGRFYEAIGTILSKVGSLLDDLRPDAFLVLGDTNSAISTLVAKRMGIPSYHMEAGNRSFDENVPEETNRRLVDHVADFNLPYNRFSELNLLREGLHPRFILRTGSPMREVLDHYGDKFARSEILDRLGFSPGGYIIASIHRQENVDSPERLANVVGALSDVSKILKKPVVLSTHPRTRSRFESLGLSDLPGVKLMEPFAFTDYMSLQMHSYCAISDSGTISEESAILGFSAVTLRDSMERPEALETGQILMSPARGKILGEAVLKAKNLVAAMPEGYEISNFSERVSRFVQSTYSISNNWKGIMP
jgi:UDP-N-acetylglucosamine 2-epimerase